MKAGKTLLELATEIQRRADSKHDLVASPANLSMTAESALSIAGQETYPVNPIAHEQISAFTEIPKKYYDRMLAESPKLLADNVNTWFAKKPESKRMVRVLDGKVRAMLSNSYRPLENEDLANAVLPVLMDLDLEIMSSEITERRLYIKAVDKKVVRELAKVGGKFGDGKHNIVRVVSPALTISNSEVGNGALSVMRSVFDSWCSNLASFGEHSVRKYHTGARHELMSDELYATLSDKTRRVTDEALWLQIRDVVKAAFDEKGFGALVDQIEGTKEDRIEGDVVKVIDLSAKRFGFNETEKGSILKQLIEGADLSRFGLHNAVTRASQDLGDYDRATELEKIGGDIITLPRSEWKEMALAA